jgi:hypothetical protein
LGKATNDEGRYQNYGTSDRHDPENAVVEAAPAKSSDRQYSNAFIARTVVALLIG